MKTIQILVFTAMLAVINTGCVTGSIGGSHQTVTMNNNGAVTTNSVSESHRDWNIASPFNGVAKLVGCAIEAPVHVLVAVTDPPPGYYVPVAPVAPMAGYNYVGGGTTFGAYGPQGGRYSYYNSGRGDNSGRYHY